MYSWEIQKALEARNFYYNSYWDFEKELGNSPQLRYDLAKDYEHYSILKLWTSDGYEWKVRINKL